MGGCQRRRASVSRCLALLLLSGCSRALDLSLGAPSNNPLEVALELTLKRPSSALFYCTSGDDPREEHLVESAPEVTSHRASIRGLLPETSYRCRARAGRSEGEVSFETPSVPLPPMLAEGQPTFSYVLFNTQRGSYTTEAAYLAIADPEGQLRFFYEVGADLVLDLDAEVERVAGGEPFIHVGGGWAHQRDDQPNKGVFRDISLSGETLLDRPAPDFGVGFNHHSERLDDGSYLSLTFHEESAQGESWYGVGVERWRPGDGLVYSWSTMPLIDAGVLPIPDLLSPYHPNSVSLVEDPSGEALWLSLYVAREIWRIAPSTGERTHVFSANGDFSLSSPEGDPLPPEDFPYVQHDPDWWVDEQGLLRVVLYDNGQGRPVETPYSRIAEFSLDLERREATLWWDWTEEGWYDPVIGDADRLPSGNVLVTQGFNRARTPNSSDVSEILELSPPGDVLWRMTFTDQDYPVFRSQAYDGCALFSNARYCEAVAERIRALGL